MNRYAIIESGAVKNTAIAEEPLAENWVKSDVACVGWAYDGVKFYPPQPEAPDMRITRLGFLSRFSDAEAIAIDLASIGATPGAAMIRRFVSKVNAAQYIDLARQDTRDGVAALEQMGLVAQGRTDEILGPPISEDEKWRG